MYYSELIANGYYFNVFKPIAAKHGPGKAMLIGLWVDKQHYWDKKVPGGWWFCSQERIQGEIGLNPKTQKKYTEWAIGLGFLETNKKSEQNIYRIYYRLNYKLLDILLQESLKDYQYSQDAPTAVGKNTMNSEYKYQSKNSKEGEEGAATSSPQPSSQDIVDLADKVRAEDEVADEDASPEGNDVSNAVDVQEPKETNRHKTDGHFSKNEDGIVVLDDSSAIRIHEKAKEQDTNLKELFARHPEEIKNIAKRNKWTPHEDVSELLAADMLFGAFTDENGKRVGETLVRREMRRVFDQYAKGV